MELLLKTKIMKKLVSGILSKYLTKATGHNIAIDIGEFHATTINGDAHMHLVLDATMPQDEFVKMIEKIS